MTANFSSGKGPLYLKSIDDKPQREGQTVRWKCHACPEDFAIKNDYFKNFSKVHGGYHKGYVLPHRGCQADAIDIGSAKNALEGHFNCCVGCA